MAANDQVNDMRPPNGPPTGKMSEHDKDALVEKLQTQLEDAEGDLENSRKLLKYQTTEISQLEAAARDLNKLREQAELDKQLIDILQQKAAQLKVATQKECDTLRAEVSQLKAAAADAEQGKLLVEELQQKVKLLEDAAAKSQHDERSIRLSERSELLTTYSTFLGLKKAVIKGQDTLAQREHACARKEAELEERNKLLDTREALAVADPTEKELEAKLQQAYDDGRKYVVTADSSEANSIQLQYNQVSRQLKCDQEHADILLKKMQAWAEDPAEWHIKVKDLADIQARKAVHDGKSPEKTLSAEEKRFQKVTANQVRNERYATTMNMVRSLSALWLMETRAMPKNRMSEFFEGDLSKPGHIISVGYRVGKAIQASILWRRGGTVDPEFNLMPGDWKEADLLPPGGDIRQLPVKLYEFWRAVGDGAEQSREDYAAAVEAAVKKKEMEMEMEEEEKRKEG